jgi:hypothetical protein
MASNPMSVEIMIDCHSFGRCRPLQDAVCLAESVPAPQNRALPFRALRFIFRTYLKFNTFYLTLDLFGLLSGGAVAPPGGQDLPWLAKFSGPGRHGRVGTGAQAGRLEA